MDTTYQDILDLAYGQSKKNTRNVIVAEATEGLRVAYRAVRGLYAAAARINPGYFGVTEEQAYVASTTLGWPRPTRAELLYRIERVSDSERVWISPIHDRLLNSDKLSVYRWGKIFKPVGGTLEPTAADSLRYFYSEIPVEPTLLSNTLPDSWNEAYNQLLGLEVAIYMAMKDDRATEIALLKAERDPWAQQFVAHLEHETVGEVREFLEDFNTSSLIAIGSLFAGGAEL